MGNKAELRVYKERCKNCLVTKNRIVSPARATEVIKSCIADDTHFICHLSQLVDGQADTCCRGFFDKFGAWVVSIRLARILNIVKEVPLPETEKLPTFDETSREESRNKKGT